MNGLILIGGQSSRMGTDKSMLIYNGLPQREYLFRLLGKFCKEVYFSAREEQVPAENVITDTLCISPISGILSAFEHNNQVAWLVLACDMPLVSEPVINTLIENRNPEKAATAFYNPVIEAPEPLIAIYEPKIFETLASYVQAGNKSPKVFLQHQDLQLIKTTELGFLKNINTKTEFDSYHTATGSEI